MMINTICKKLFGAVLIFFCTLLNVLYAQGGPPPPPGGGGGGTTPEAAATPIDMYQIILLIVAIGLVAFFYKKVKFSKI